MSKDKETVVVTRQVINSVEDLIKQAVSFHDSYESAMSAPRKHTKYFIGSGGVYKMVTNDIGSFITEAEDIVGAKQVKLGVSLSLPSKIPYELLLQTISFFRDVYTQKNKAEAMVQIFWDVAKEEYFAHCPEQEITKASVKFKKDPVLEKNHILIADIHSHNDMSAQFSGQDDSDDKEVKIYGVIGRLDLKVHEITFRISTGKEFAEISMFDVFEDPFPQKSYPAEWLDKCTSPAASPTQTKSLFEDVDMYDRYPITMGSSRGKYGSYKTDKYDTKKYVNDWWDADKGSLFKKEKNFSDKELTSIVDEVNGLYHRGR